MHQSTLITYYSQSSEINCTISLSHQLIISISIIAKLLYLFLNQLSDFYHNKYFQFCITNIIFNVSSYYFNISNIQICKYYFHDMFLLSFLNIFIIDLSIYFVPIKIALFKHFICLTSSHKCFKMFCFTYSYRIFDQNLHVMEFNRRFIDSAYIFWKGFIILLLKFMTPLIHSLFYLLLHIPAK